MRTIASIALRYTLEIVGAHPAGEEVIDSVTYRESLETWAASFRRQTGTWRPVREPSARTNSLKRVATSRGRSAYLTPHDTAVRSR